MGKKQLMQTFYSTPEIKENECIAQILETKGGGLYSAVIANSTTELLVFLPPKFHKLIYVKKRTWVVLCLMPDSTTKVKAEIIHVLHPLHIKELKQQGNWPIEDEPIPLEESGDSSQEEDDLFVNTNRYHEESDD